MLRILARPNPMIYLCFTKDEVALPTFTFRLLQTEASLSIMPPAC
jgi:hypothetical protein